MIIGIIYIVMILVCLYFLFSAIDIKDLTSYEFIKSNKDVIIKFKNENFWLLTLLFFIFSIIWTLLLGFATPLLLFGGFVFGKWWGILIVLTSTTIGASLLYIMVGFFLKEMIEQKLAPKFLKLKKFFAKNDIIYFMSYRFVGGGGTPFAIQNMLPVLFNMPIKNYIIATFLGSAPSMFISVSLGDGIESIIDKNEKISFFNVATSPEIYLPIMGFVIILILAFIIKKLYFKEI